MSRKFIIESRSRINSADSTTNFTVAVPDLAKIRKMKLISAIIPLTFLLINNSNNTFQITENGGAVFNIILSNGSYTATTLATEISNKMTAIATGPYTATISAAGVLTISTAGPTFAINTVSVASNPTSIGRILGFGATATGLAASHTSPNVTNLNGPNGLYITSSIIGGALDELVVLSSPDVTNIIDFVPISEPLGSVQVLVQNLNDREIYIADPETFTQVDIQIRYPGGTIVDLQGADVTLVFSINLN